jgi:hypothetical protein
VENIETRKKRHIGNMRDFFPESFWVEAVLPY